MVGIYNTQFKITLLEFLQYRAAMVIWMIDLVLEPLILLSVWSSVARSQGGMVEGYAVQDFAAYYLALMVTLHFTEDWHLWDFDWYIRQGEMSQHLIRPFHPVHRHLVESAVYKYLMLLVIVPVVIVLALLFQPAFHITLANLLLYIPALLLGALLSFFAGYVVGMTAFWTARVNALVQMYFVAMTFFSGQLAPLELMPPFWRFLADLLPFRWINAHPTQLLLGRLSANEVIVGFAAQVFWIVLLIAVFKVLWRLGLRRYGAVGG
ncbi:MAG: ABC-2 family transporter protein [Chloroflexi bacterium]|nr:ABC-2 family transporter protein [Chloroflexota bacterium]